MGKCLGDEVAVLEARWRSQPGSPGSRTLGSREAESASWSSSRPTSPTEVSLNISASASVPYYDSVYDEGGT